MRDLGLNYEAASHGIQSAVRFEMSREGFADDEQSKIVRMLKHLRVGIDMRACDAQGLASLLIEKGIITLDEYLEAIRRGANEELARYEDHVRSKYGLSEKTSFR